MSSLVSATRSDGSRGAAPKRPRRSLGRRLLAANAVSFAILLVAGALSLHSAQRFARTSRRVEHSIEVLYGLSSVLGMVTDEESGLRGYALTGRLALLRPYESARSRIAQELARMRRLTADDSAQQARLVTLEHLVAERHDFADALVETRRRRGLVAAAGAVAMGQGNALMAEMRRLLADMASEEHQRLARRAEIDRVAARRTILLTGGLATTALLVVIASSVLLSRAVSRPTERLLRGVARVAAGDLNVRVPIETDDELGRLATSFNDMVWRRRGAEQALARANAFLESIFRATPLAIVGVDADGTVDFWNPVAEALFGYSPDEVIGRPLPIVPAEGQAAFDHIREHVLGRGELVLDLASKRRRKDGTVFDARISAAPRLENGVPRGMLAIIGDVTEQRRAEEERRRSEAALSRAQRVAHLGSWERDLRTGVFTRSAEVYAIFGVAPDAALTAPKTLGRLVHPDDRVRVARTVAVAEREGGSFDIEHRLRRPDGEERIVRVRGECDVEDGRPVRMNGTILDVTDIRRAERELERLRAEWNSIVAHDLRQPLNTISLNAQLLARRATAGVERTHAEHIASATRRLDRMINDLLDLSRLDAKQLALTKESVALPALVRASVARAAITAEGRSFSVRSPEEVPPVSADPDRVAQVLDNLLSNALKYGAPGTPISVEIEPGEREVAVAVTNAGAGIEPDELPHLFQRFHRTDEARRSGIKGIGLGLYITRELVEAHGGRVTAASTGDHTTFRFTLPRAA